MKRSRMIQWLIAGMLMTLATAPAAAQRTVTLAVDNMSCASCPYIVEQSLERVDGVVDATVSFEEHTVVVRYDNAQTDVDALTHATGDAGYPSRVAEQQP